MHDATPVNVGHRPCHLQEQADAPRDAELSRLAPLVERQAADVFQHQVRATFGIVACVAKAGDVGMVHQGADFAFMRDAARQTVVQRPARHFQRELTRRVGAGALGQPDGAHAASTDLFQQPVGTGHVPGMDRLVLCRSIELRTAPSPSNEFRRGAFWRWRWCERNGPSPAADVRINEMAASEPTRTDCVDALVKARKAANPFDPRPPHMRRQ